MTSTFTRNHETEESLYLSEYQLREKIANHPLLRQVIAHVRQQKPADMAHDLSHLSRVLANVLQISQQEGGDFEILVVSAMLHDIKNFPKNDVRSKSSSSVSAAYASKYLTEIGFPKEKISVVEEAILCHSFTKGLQPKTLEGKILQDADRLDSLGAIGIARLFGVSGSMGRRSYHPEDPFWRTGRPLDDLEYSIDHLFKKIFKLADLMHTKTAKQLAYDRTEVIRQYLDVLEREINPAFECFLAELQE